MGSQQLPRFAVNARLLEDAPQEIDTNIITMLVRNTELEWSALQILVIAPRMWAVKSKLSQMANQVTPLDRSPSRH